MTSMTVRQQILALREQLNTVAPGQHRLLDRLVTSLLTGGHVLVEGLPGLAKTTAVKALADGAHACFKRLQFTPDLLPADLTGSEVYLADRHEFGAGPGLRLAVQALEAAARYGGAASDIGALRACLLTALGGHRLRLSPMNLRFREPGALTGPGGTGTVSVR
ncbi:MAG: AAA family ATPase [Thioalkalivibrio sp.]